jgi:hypothetical protein
MRIPKTILTIAVLIAVSGAVVGYRFLDSRVPATQVSSDNSATNGNGLLRVPPEPVLSYLVGSKPFVQINFDFSIPGYLNIYRAEHPEGPWSRIDENVPTAAHVTADYAIPTGVDTLYYRTTALVDSHESVPSAIASVRIK